MSSDSVERKPEERPVEQKRIDGIRAAGRFLRDSEDLQWLYFDLALRGRLDEFELKDIARGRSDAPGSGLLDQAARYIEQPMYHCTALRDLFIVRLMDDLLPQVANDPPPNKVNWKRRVALCFFPLAAVPFCWIYYSWWSAVLAFVFFWIMVSRTQAQYDGNANNEWSFRRDAKRFTQDTIGELIARVRQGGFDEPTLIEQIQLFDVTKTTPPNSAAWLWSRGNTIIPIQIPDVFYALLRLPRRNLENEISRTFFNLDKRKRVKLLEQWRRFVDRLVNYESSEKYLASGPFITQFDDWLDDTDSE